MMKAVELVNSNKFSIMDEIEILREEIKSLIDNADEKTIRMTYAMLEAGAVEDWWNELDDEGKSELEQAIEESENPENFIAVETFQQEFNKWRKELLSSKEQNKK